MESIGLPKQVAKQIGGLYQKLNRYFKVAGSFGSVLRQANGVGQGCSISLLIANAYVTVLTRFLQQDHPHTDMASFLDDRNVTAPNIDLLIKAIEGIRNYDDIAGHFTNLDKSALFATNETDRKKLRTIDFGSQAPPTVLKAKFVGHNLNTTRRASCTIMDGRADTATMKAERIAKAQIPRRHKVRLLEAAAMPSAHCGNLWETISQMKLARMRTVFNKKRCGARRGWPGALKSSRPSCATQSRSTRGLL